MLKPNIDREALTQTLKDLVKIDSVNPSDVEPSRPNVVGVLKGTGGGKTLLLNGHTDTVGVDYMTIDPFDPVIKDNKLYGRGSFDMKGGLAASMAAVKTIVEENTILKGNIILATVCDEEYASIGTEHLMKNTTANAAIVGEFTGGNIQVAHKGFAWLDIETYGVAAHGSLYRIGVDAIAKMGHILIGLEEIGQNLEKTEHPLVGPGSIHASIIEGGSELSTYPASCKLQIERRLIPGEDKDDVDEEISNLIKSLEACDPKFNADYRITFYRGPMEISPKEEICRVLEEGSERLLEKEAICRVLEEGSERLLEKTPRYIGGTAWMDTQIIHSKGIPAIAYGPLGYGAHAEEEWVDLKSVYETALVHWYAIKEFCEAS
jgi:acetylornithine deacetylase